MTIDLKYLFIIIFTLSGLYWLMYFAQPTPTQTRNVYYVDSCEDLDNMRNDLNGIYIQTADIDCKGYKGK